MTNVKNFEELIEKLEKNSTDHVSVTGDRDGTYHMFAVRWSDLVEISRRICLSIRNEESYSARENLYSLMDNDFHFIDGFLRGLVAGCVITESERLVLYDILTGTVYRGLDELD